MATLVKEKPKHRKKKDESKSIVINTSYKENSMKSSSQICSNDDLVDILTDSASQLPDENLLAKETIARTTDIENIKSDNNEDKTIINIDKKVDTVKTDITEQSLPEDLDSKTERKETILKDLETATNAFRDVSKAAKDLTKDVSKLKLDRIQESKRAKTKSAYVNEPTSSYSLDDIAAAFGVKEIISARNYVIEFKHKEYQPVSNRHVFFELLMSYKLARNQLQENNNAVMKLKKENGDKINFLWKFSNYVASSKADICIHQKKFSFEETYRRATLSDKDLSQYCKIGAELRDKVTESHSTFSHNEHVLKIQIDDLLWRASLSVETIIESLRIIFWVMLTTGRGPDTHYNKQLTDWCLFLGTELLKKEPSLKNTLFILHHLLRLSQNLSWSYSLIQCEVSSISDISKALALLETILLSRKIVSHNAEDKQSTVENKETSDDDTWLVVDLSEEMPDAELMVADGSTLRESDILGFIGQIPFDQIFKELMFVKSNGYGLLFCGTDLSPELVLKIFCGARIAFPIIKGGFLLYNNYKKLSSELCKLTYQFVMYCTDLWEATRTKWNELSIKRLSAEYDNLFKAAWATMDCCGDKDTAAMFQSLLPFSSVPETTLIGMFEDITRKVIVFDHDHCYRTFETLSNMALARREPEFVLRITKYLFNVGFTSDNSSKACGGVARTLCGTILKHHSGLMGEILLEMTKLASVGFTPQGEWLESLPLTAWRPTAEQLATVLKAWNISCQSLLPYLIQSMDCNCRSGLSLSMQRDVAIFLAGLSQSFVRQKLPIPAWIFDCLISLRIHAIDWGYALESAPEPESLEGLEISELLLGSTNSACSRCHASALVVLAGTTWGHSLPVFYQKGVLLLIRLANAGRHREVVHILYYTIIVLTQSPEAVKDSPPFKELLSTLLNSDKSYAKMATRFITGDVPGPIARLLIDLIKTQITQYQQLMLPSPAPVLTVWIQWLMSLDNWSSDFSILYLADTVISCCFNDGPSMATAFEMFKNYIQDHVTSSGSTGLWGGNWFFGGGGSPFKGVIQCPGAEVPVLWLVTMQAEHAVLERTSGLWSRLLVKLAEKKEGKVNIDKALKSVGGQDNSAGLTLYRAAQYAVVTPVTHPYHTIMWQFFFSLYLDTSALEYSQELRPIGHLFFRGVVNSRLLSRLRSRLDDARAHHEMQHKRYTKMALDKMPSTDNKEKSRKDSAGNYLDEYSQRAEFHRNQTMHMDAFKVWLDEDALRDLLDGQVVSNCSQFMFAKLESLIRGHYFPWMDTIDNFESRKHAMARWPSVLLDAKPKSSQEESPLPATPADPPSPDARILARLGEAAKERTVKGLKCGYAAQPVLSPTISAREAIALANNALVNIKQFDILYSNAQSALTAEDNIIQRLITQMYKDRMRSILTKQYCLEPNCPGVQLTLQYNESYLDNSVMEQINSNRVAFNASLQKLLVSFDGLARMTEILINVSQFPWAIHRNKLSSNESSTFFFTVLDASSSLNCLPLRDAVSTAASKLGTVFVSGSGPQCSALIRRCRIKVGEAEYLSHERRATVVGSLLRPLELPVEEFVDVYRTITTDVLDPHVTFSFLSKFDVTVWLKLHNPTAELITEFLTLLVHKIAASGPKPPSQDMIVQELLCIHLCRTLQWSWPHHLPEVLGEMSQLACDDQLPPEAWEHLAKVIEANSHQMQLHCCTACGTSLGLSFETARRRRAPRATWQGTAQAVHSSAVARIGAAIGAAATAAAMLHRPTIMADKIAHIVFTISCSIFDPWLVPWWGASCRSSPAEEPQMPWGLADAKLVEVIFDAFVESMLYIVNTLPGSEVALLRCAWSWYIWHYHRYNPHHPQTQSWQTIPDYIIVLTHQQLARLPWHLHSWVALHEMESAIGLCGRPHFNEFAAHCLRGLRSESGSWDWVSGQMHCLNLVLFTLISLPLDQKIIDDVTDYLPWRNLDSEFFKEVLRRFFSSLSTSSEVLYQHRLIRLLCAAAGLRATRDAHPLQKKLALVEHWAKFLDRKSQKNLENIGTDLTALLDIIEKGAKSVPQDGENGFISEGDLAASKALFEAVVGLLNVESLRDHILQDWTQFMSECNQLSSRAIACCTIKLTNKEIYGTFSESALDAYFRNGDDWHRLLIVWKSNSLADLEFLVKCGHLMSAFVSMSCIQQDMKGTSILLNKNMLKALKDTNPSSKNEKGIILWTIFVLELVSMDSSALFGDQFEMRSQLLLLVKQWSEEQGWGILKAIGLAQNTAPSQRFRIVMMYLQTIKLFVSTSKQEVIAQLANPGSQQNKIIKSMESMMHHKSCSEFKESVSKCVEWAKNITFLDEWKTNLQNLCKELYPEYVHLYQYKM